MGKNKHYNKIDTTHGYVENQAMELNMMTYQFHFQNLYELALNRVKWIHLPKGCDARFLEETLLQFGQAIMFQDPKIKGLFYTTRVIATLPLTIYNKSTKFRSIANNGWNTDVAYKDAVMCYDTNSRFPILNHISLFANRLTDIDRTKDINLKIQKTPFIITGPEEKTIEIQNFYNNINNNEPAIFGLTGMMNDVKIEVLPTNVPYLGEELNYSKQLVINEFLTSLGIDNSGLAKQERMTAGEVDTQNGQIMGKRLNTLNPRREFTDDLNRKFKFDPPIQCVWNTDNITDNYNLVTNLEKEIKLEGGNE